MDVQKSKKGSSWNCRWA